MCPHRKCKVVLQLARPEYDVSGPNRNNAKWCRNGNFLLFFFQGVIYAFTDWCLKCVFLVLKAFVGWLDFRPSHSAKDTFNFTLPTACNVLPFPVILGKQVEKQSVQNQLTEMKVMWLDIFDGHDHGLIKINPSNNLQILKTLEWVTFFHIQWRRFSRKLGSATMRPFDSVYCKKTVSVRRQYSSLLTPITLHLLPLSPTNILFSL